MKRSNISGRSLASLVMLLGATFTILLLPAYAQQEVTPSWYDPWAAPSATARRSRVAARPRVSTRLARP